MPRPSTFWSSSMTTALVVVEPRSMPMKQRMAFPFQWASAGAAAAPRFCLTIWK